MKKQEKKSHKIGIEPLADRVLIQEEDVKQSKTDSGIYIPDTVKEDRGSKRGKVIAVGKGRHDDGVLIAPQVKVGDTVLFQWGDQIKFDDKEYFIVRESEIIAIIN